MTPLADAADAHGVFDHADARRAGYEPRDLTRLARAGTIVLLARGWYAVNPPPEAEARHALLTLAMLRSHEGRAAAANHSALVLAHLPTDRPDLSRCRLARLEGGSPRTRRGLSLGRVVASEWVVPVPDGPADALMVRPALAAVQSGFSGTPLSALIAADGALYSEQTTPEELQAVLELVRHYPRARAVARAVQRADGRHASAGETRLGEAFHLLGIDVTPQFEITESGLHAFVDFLVDGEDVVVEFDGKVKYGRSIDAVDANGRLLSPSEVLWLEKRREDGIRELGYEVVRVVWSELFDLPALERRIRAAIARARARRIGRTA